jgi:LysM repeat protein
MSKLSKGIAILLAVILCIPDIPVYADTVIDEDSIITFNTGSYEYKLVSEEEIEALYEEYQEAVESGEEDDQQAMELMHYQAYDEDGSYTIQLEADAFFPYEVQFTYGGTTYNKWFETPDSIVKIGGHKFRVTSQTSGEVVTQMSLTVAGKTVVVYPEEKEFVNDENSLVSVATLLPIEERKLTAPLSEFSPLELSRVKVTDVFTGDKAVGEKQYVMYKRKGTDDDYQTASLSSPLNLSYYTTSYGTSTSWEMIVGEKDQLADSNIRYIVSVEHADTSNWLTPSVYRNDNGNRVPVATTEISYYDYGSRELYVRTQGSYTDKFFVSLSLNQQYADAAQKNIKVFEGKIENEDDLKNANNITDNIWDVSDLTEKDSGYQLESYSYQWITLVEYDSDKAIIGLLPVQLDFYSRNGLYQRTMYKVENGSTTYIVSRNDYSYNNNGVAELTISLYKGYPADGQYTYSFEWYENDSLDNSKVTAAYVGNYNSIAAAKAAGAKSVKDSLFAADEKDGYTADYSNGIYFSIFIGNDGEEQTVYKYYIKTVASETPKPSGDSSAYCEFTAVKDANKKNVMLGTSVQNDSYGESNYYSIFVKEDADLTHLALEFEPSSAKLYAEGSTSPEVSGESYHDFSDGPIQFTVSSEDGQNSKNYWVEIVKEESGSGKLFVTSLSDKASEITTGQDGSVHSKREIMLDSYHSYRHDILVANVGDKAITNLSVSLDSDVLELNDYWTFNEEGTHELKAMSDLKNGKLQNLAKVRLTKKSDVEDGADITGTLTFKSGDKTLMVLELTGYVGDPCITTEELPGELETPGEIVNYVPYGTMIQNNNKYSWNKVTYETDDTLPEGMQLLSDGELYGVPKIDGLTDDISFTFTVTMKNSYSGFSESKKTYTITVKENTDENIESATDDGYELKERLSDTITESSTGTLSLRSYGEYSQFQDVYLDGVKLEQGADKDYVKSEGSTIITVRSETLTKKTGRHTISIEFRNSNNEVKKTAQNYNVVRRNSNTSGGGSGSGGSSSSSSSTNKVDKVNSSNSSSSSSSSSSSKKKTSKKKTSKKKTTTKKTTKTSTITKTYTVKSGDTLWKIAVKYYKNGTLWKKIYNANKDKISSPSKLRVGQKIKIPAK